MNHHSYFYNSATILFCQETVVYFLEWFYYVMYFHTGQASFLKNKEPND